MNSYGFVLLVALCTCCSLAKEMTDIEILTSQPTRCSYEHAFDMYGAHCAGLRLTKIPHLRGGIEILDFSDNKLHEITDDTLSGYTSIKFLYLTENNILTIEENAFSSLTDLQTLDLSKNVILELPPNILQLPNLRKLYLGSNPLIHVNLDKFAENKHIRAPLELLDLSDCKIKVLPEWGLLPQLMFYNISYNPLTALEVKHFPVMCRLAKIDITKSIEHIKLCDLKPAISWFQEKLIYFTLDDYTTLNTKEFERCRSTYDAEAYNATFNQCKQEFLQMESRPGSRRTWLTITGGLAGFLVGFVLLLYLMHRHNVARAKTKEKPKDGDKNANAMLLYNVS